MKTLGLPPTGSFTDVGGPGSEVSGTHDATNNQAIFVAVNPTSKTELRGFSFPAGSPTFTMDVCATPGCADVPSVASDPTGAVVVGTERSTGQLKLFFCVHTPATGCTDRSSSLPVLPNDSGLEPSVTLAPGSQDVVIASRDGSPAGGDRVRLTTCPALGSGACTSYLMDPAAPLGSGLHPAVVVPSGSRRAVVFSQQDLSSLDGRNGTLRSWTADLDLGAPSAFSNLTSGDAGHVFDGAYPVPLVLPGFSGPEYEIWVVALTYSSDDPSGPNPPRAGTDTAGTRVALDETNLFASDPVLHKLVSGANGTVAATTTPPSLLHSLVSSDVSPPSLISVDQDGYGIVVNQVVSAGRNALEGFRFSTSDLTASFLDDSLNLNAGQTSLGISKAGSAAVFDPVSYTMITGVTHVDNGNSLGLVVQPLVDLPLPVVEMSGYANGSSLVVSWDEPILMGSSISSYVLQWGTAFDTGLFETVFLPALPGGGGRFVATNLTADTPYVFRVRTVSGYGETPLSQVFVHTFVSGAGPPRRMQAPLLLDGQPTSVEIVWSPATDGGDPIVFYELEVTPGGIINIGLPNDFRFVVSGLTPDTEYTIAIRANNNNGTSPFSPPLVVSTDTINIGPPDAPPRPTVSAVTSSSLRLDWLQPADNNEPITSYDVFQVPPSSIVATSGTTFALITGLVPNARYFFSVSATNANGTSSYSSSLAVVTDTINAPPEAPGSLALDSGVATTASSVGLAWTAPPDNLADPPFSYDIRYTLVASGVDTSGVPSSVTYTLPVLSGMTPPTQAVVENLLPATTYSFAVAARNANGTSAFIDSGGVEATTLATTPDAPNTPVVVNIDATAINMSVVLEGSDGGDAVQVFEVYRNGDLAGSVPAGPGGSSVVFEDTGLTPSTLYAYTAVAVNGAGSSDASSVLSVQTESESEAVARPVPPPEESNSLVLYAGVGVGLVVILLLIVVVVLLLRRRASRANAGPPMPDFEPFRFGKYGTTPVKPAVAARTAQVESVLPLLFEHPSLAVLNAMLSVVDPADADDFARSLMAVALAKGKEKEVILAACALEVEKATSLGTLFRVNSVATKLMQAYSKAVGLPYMWEAVGRHVATWYYENHEEGGEGGPVGGAGGNDRSARSLSTRSLEIDTAKVDVGTAETNKYLLMAMCQQFFESIVTTGKFVPVGMRRICLFLQNAVSAKFPTVGTTPTNSYLFLRFLNPAVSAPEAFGLVPSPPTRDERRQLILVTKVLQNLANGVLFGTKERFMVQLNPFLTTNTPRLNEYVRDVLDINVPSFDPFPPASEMPDSVLPLALGVLHGYLARVIGKKEFKNLLKGTAPMPGYEVLPNLSSSSSSSSSSYSSSSSSYSSGGDGDGGGKKTKNGGKASKAVGVGATPMTQPLLPLPTATTPGAIALTDGVEMADMGAPMAPMAPIVPMAADAGLAEVDFSFDDDMGVEEEDVEYGSMLFHQFRIAVQALGEPLTKKQLFPAKK